MNNEVVRKHRPGWYLPVICDARVGGCLVRSQREVDLCGELSRFVDFENTVDRGSAVIFDVDSGLCLSYVRTKGPTRNLDQIFLQP